jgi:hypothetical protein
VLSDALIYFYQNQILMVFKNIKPRKLFPQVIFGGSLSENFGHIFSEVARFQ